MLDDIVIQIREFHDKSFSVMARVWTPQKRFYEHPTLINLTKKEAEDACTFLTENLPSLSEIVNQWEFIGT